MTTKKTPSHIISEKNLPNVMQARIDQIERAELALMMGAHDNNAKDRDTLIAQLKADLIAAVGEKEGNAILNEYLADLGLSDAETKSSARWQIPGSRRHDGCFGCFNGDRTRQPG